MAVIYSKNLQTTLGPQQIVRADSYYSVLEAPAQTLQTAYCPVEYAVDRLPLDQIVSPTLIVEGSADDDVTPEHARYAHSTIAHSDLLWVDSGSHIGFWAAPDAYKTQRYVLDWIRSTEREA